MSRRFTLCALAVVLAISTGAAALRASQAHDQPLSGARSPRNASYDIDVRLDERAHTLTGRETIRWRNISANPASELQFHLYWNAWRNADSTWLRERRLGGGAAPRAEMFGSIDVTAIRLRQPAGAVDLTKQRRFIAPDDGNAADRTVMVVPLPTAVAPLEEVVLDLEWTAKIPRPFARTGWIGDYYFIGQWFPKIGVLEDQGWNTHQFHLTTEFYADFGVYDVRITAPSAFVVGASGKQAGATRNENGTTTHRFRGEDIHDFGWAASPRFIDLRRAFTHPTLPRVEMRLLLLDERRGQEERYFQIVSDTLRLYGEWFGPYPYDHLTIVDPAYQSQSDGMEYPTLFTGRSRLIVPRNVQVPESTTAHEAGHQWWYAMVATNEVEHGWMDEGINTFATARVIDQVFRTNYVERRYFGGFVPWVFRDIAVRRDVDGNRLAAYRTGAEGDVPSTPTFRYWPGSANAIMYSKTPLWLHTLENVIGWPALRTALATYFDRWKFRHPQPDDFFAIVDETTGQDMRWFFDQVYRSSNTFDYAVQDFSTIRSGDRYRTTVVAQRLGEATFPVDVLTTFANGERVTERWDGAARRQTWSYDKPSAATAVQIDPGRVLLLDVNYTNNSRTLAPRATEAGLKWALKWMVWMQDLMLTYGFFA